MMKIKIGVLPLLYLTTIKSAHQTKRFSAKLLKNIDTAMVWNGFSSLETAEAA